MDRKVVITGASSGIGLAAAEAFLRAGDRLFLIGNRHMEVLDALALSYPEQVIACRADLSDADATFAASEAVKDCFGTPDILVNAAGIAKDVLFQDSDEDFYQKILAVNLSSAVRLTRAFLPGMIRRGSGRILNVSSVYGRAGASMEVEYSLTKGAIDSFTRSLAKEVAPSGISVNAVAPGFIDTPMNAGYTAEEFAAIEAEIPAGRAGTASEAADLLVLLADAPSYLTGEIIRIDGGWFA